MISSRLTGRDSLLFVYGTLRPFVDIAMARWLRGAARYLGTATHARPALRSRRLSRHERPRAACANASSATSIASRIRASSACSIATKPGARGKPVRARALRREARSRRPQTAWAYRYRYSVVSAARIASGDYRVHCESAAAEPQIRAAVMSMVSDSRRARTVAPRRLPSPCGLRGVSAAKLAPLRREARSLCRAFADRCRRHVLAKS